MAVRDPNIRTVSAPRGTELSAKSWLTEAPLRMLMNNLDAEAAENPQELVVYDGIGKAARNWECFDQIVANLKELAGLIESLTEAKAAGNLTRRLRVLTHPALLVVDEIGYLPVNQDGAVLFFQLINARHEKASTVLTSNKGFEDWGGVLGDEVMAAALIDRLVHHCHIVNIRGNSYRMKDHQNLLQSGSDRRRKRAAE